MIQSFKDKGTEDLFNGYVTSKSRRIPNTITDASLRKLDMLNAAMALNDMKSPPGNRLEALKGDYAGYHIIRINSQWRIVFKWTDSGPHEVEITDYHS
jgi:toxin HigB-1